MVERLCAGKLPRRQLVKALRAIGVSTAGVNAIVASAESSSAAEPSPTVDVTEDSATHLQMHDQHLANQAQGNTSELHDHTLRGVTVIIREDDKIVREALYYGVTDLYRQLG